MSARKRCRKLKIARAPVPQFLVLGKSDQCRLLCIWVITQRSFVTTQITAT